MLRRVKTIRIKALFSNGFDVTEETYGIMGNPPYVIVMKLIETESKKVNGRYPSSRSGRTKNDT